MAGDDDSKEVGGFEPDLKKEELEEVEKRTGLRAIVVHEAIRKEGEEELCRSLRGVAWSGLAAGLSMGFSLVAEAALTSHLPDTVWRPIISKFGYTVGFLVVTLGRQQLYTETTLTAMVPLLSHRTWEMARRVSLFWLVVLGTNLLGAFLFAQVVGQTASFHSDTRYAFEVVGRHAVAPTFGTALLRGIFAGWLIALIVWLTPAAGNSQALVIIMLSYVVGLAGLTHIVAGSVEVMTLAVIGGISWQFCLSGYIVPTLIGNTIGGVALVAALNHAQVVAGER